MKKKEWLTLMVFLMFLFNSIISAQIQVEKEQVIFTDEAITMELNIPVLSGFSFFTAETLNLILRSEIFAFAQRIMSYAEENYAYYLKHPTFFWTPFQVYSNFEVFLNNDQYFSLTFLLYEYSGGAHGFSVLQSINFDLVKNRLILGLDDLDLIEGYPDIIVKLINQEISSNQDDYYHDLPLTYIPENGFYLTAEGIVIYYQLYELAPYAMGFPEFLIPWEQLR